MSWKVSAESDREPGNCIVITGGEGEESHVHIWMGSYLAEGKVGREIELNESQTWLVVDHLKMWLESRALAREWGDELEDIGGGA